MTSTSTRQAYCSYSNTEYTYLHASFCQIDAHGEILAHEDVWIVRLGKRGLQLLQLVAGERGAEPPLLPFALGVAALGARVGFAVRRFGQLSLFRRGWMMIGEAVRRYSFLSRRIGQFGALDVFGHLGRRLLHSCYGHGNRITFQLGAVD